MAIRRSMNVDHYKAQQAKPLFLSEPPRFVTKRAPFAGIMLWAALMCLAAGAGTGVTLLIMLVL